MDKKPISLTTLPPGAEGTSLAPPLFARVLSERMAAISRLAHDLTKGNSPAATEEQKLGRELRILLPILRRRFPPDGLAPYDFTHQKVWNIVEPDYRELGRTPPSIDTIARARGRRKKYTPRPSRPKK